MFALLCLIFMRVPVAICMGLVGFFGYAAIDGWQRAAAVLGSTPFDIASGYALSVVPLFVLMGELGSASGMSSRLFRGTSSLFGGTRGALAYASIGANAAFGAVCGSSVASAATMTRICVPEMRRLHYDDRLSTGSVAAGGTLGILIPPSLIFVIYAMIAQQSVPKLFAAGLFPGLVLTGLYTLVAALVVLFRPAWAPRGAVAAMEPAGARCAGHVGIRPALRRLGGRHLCGLFQPDRSCRHRVVSGAGGRRRSGQAEGSGSLGMLRRDAEDNLHAVHDHRLRHHLFLLRGSGATARGPGGMDPADGILANRADADADRGLRRTGMLPRGHRPRPDHRARVPAGRRGQRFRSDLVRRHRGHRGGTGFDPSSGRHEPLRHPGTSSRSAAPVHLQGHDTVPGCT